ncbi:MAG: hypothetical protein MUF19_04165 [Candidatus Pacebacteria bacterium]|nr:hypothetical protein [Candidatus Paceibacterota bacterium]
MEVIGYVLLWYELQTGLDFAVIDKFLPEIFHDPAPWLAKLAALLLSHNILFYAVTSH